jgi:hypothetical protein
MMKLSEFSRGSFTTNVCVLRGRSTIAADSGLCTVVVFGEQNNNQDFFQSLSYRLSRLICSGTEQKAVIDVSLLSLHVRLMFHALAAVFQALIIATAAGRAAGWWISPRRYCSRLLDFYHWIKLLQKLGHHCSRDS